MNRAKTKRKKEKGVLYCRVSSKKQAGEGSGLESQEHRCREYALEQGYEVVAVFPDDVSGGGDFMNRPGMTALLAFLDAYPDENFIVIFDDLKRYARDVEFHLKLKREMEARNARRECLNFKFERRPRGSSLKPLWQRKESLRGNRMDAKYVKKCRPVSNRDSGFSVRL